MNILDTRDLIETRNELLEQINSTLLDYGIDEIDSFDTEDELKIHIENWAKENKESLPEDYIVIEDIDEEVEEREKEYRIEDFTEDVFNDINETEDYLEIQQIESKIGSEFNYGVTLIDEDDFEDYCKDLLEDCGYISRDFPSWIEIDWSATASNMEDDYSRVEYKGTEYLYR